MSTVQNFNINDRNTELPFYPSFSYELAEADKGKENLQPFDWIQAFFDSTQLGGPAQLAIWSGKLDANGDPILSLVRFAYSGERVNFKGCAIFDTGTDIRGQVVSSTTIGVTPTTDLLQVLAYGGMY